MKQFLVLILLLTLAIHSTAQDSSSAKQPAPELLYVETIDHIKFLGAFVAEDENWLQLENRSLGVVSVLKSRIKRIQQVDPSRMRYGTYWYPDPSCTRYFGGPSSFNPHKGETILRNTYLIFQGLDAGITEHLSLSCGTELVSPLQREPPRIYYLGSKLSIPLGKKLTTGIGLLFLHSEWAIGSGGGVSSRGVIYASLTAGDEDINFTVGIGGDGHKIVTEGYHSAVHETSGISSKPILSFSGIARLGQHLSLITENWVFPVRNSHFEYHPNRYEMRTDFYYVLTYGLRIMGEKAAVDFGFMNNEDLFPILILGFPYASVSMKFGGNKYNGERDWSLDGKY